ncbi:MAG: metallophosphoesterase family protein [Planctomycetota bacterium]
MTSRKGRSRLVRSSRLRAVLFLLSACLLVLMLLLEVGARLAESIGARSSSPAFVNRSPPKFPTAPIRVCFLADVQRGLAGVVRPLARELDDSNIELLISSGDLVSHGEAPYYGLVFGAFDRAKLTIPTLVVPGNHDVQPDCQQAYEPGRRLFERAIGPRWWSTTVGEVLILGIDNSLAPICAEQLEWLRLELAVHPIAPYVLVCHRPPLDLDRPASRLTDDPALIALLEYRVPCAVICGHAHADRDVTVRGVRYLCNAQGGDLGHDDREFGPSDFWVILADIRVGGVIDFHRRAIERDSVLQIYFESFCVRMWIERRARPWLSWLLGSIGVVTLVGWVICARERGPSA